MSKNEKNVPSEKIVSFTDLGIKESILKIISGLGLTTPTPIQLQAIPAALSGQDIVGIAQTGTGKTFAFGIPMLQQLALNKGRGLVVLPTRELASQVEKSLHSLGGPLGLRTALVIGGEPVFRQLPALRRHPHIVVGTPGRLIDLLKSGNLKLDTVSVLVFDEADMMFDMGFAPQIEEIMKSVPKDRQTLLFSATMPLAVMKLAEKNLKTPVRVEVAPAGTTAALVDQEIYIMSREERWNQLINLLKEYQSSVLVFVRTKHGASKLNKKLKADGYKAAEIHSNLSFSQRQASLAGFKSGQHRILVATDVAARGLDINDIELVLNFDLPDNSEDYVHRIGRTARAGKKGKAISFASPQQGREVQRIEQLIRKNLPIKKIANSSQGSATFVANNFDRSGRPQRISRQRADKPISPVSRGVGQERPERKGRPERRERPESKEIAQNTSLGFRKRADQIDPTATPDYLQPRSPRGASASYREKDNDRRKRPQSNSYQSESEEFVPLMQNNSFDGGNRFAFRRNLYQLREAAKGRPRRTFNKREVQDRVESQDFKSTRPAARADFKTGVRTSGSKSFKPKAKTGDDSRVFKAKSFTPRHKRKQ
jgi:ATP-dependent RNA helicase RhlE